MNKIIDPLTQFLTDKSVHFRWDEARQVLDLGMGAENARWQCFARQDAAGRFVLVSLLPLNAPAARRNACALLLARINGGLGLGHFEIDFDDGELGYRTVVPVPKKGRLSRDLMESSMATTRSSIGSSRRSARCFSPVCRRRTRSPSPLKPRRARRRNVASCAGTSRGRLARSQSLMFFPIPLVGRSRAECLPPRTARTIPPAMETVPLRL